MGSLVDFEPASSRIALATDITLKWLLASMDKFVCLQVSLRDELLTAALKGAGEGSFSSLQSQK